MKPDGYWAWSAGVWIPTVRRVVHFAPMPEPTLTQRVVRAVRYRVPDALVTFLLILGVFLCFAFVVAQMATGGHVLDAWLR